MKIRCEVCHKILAEDTGTEWLKVLLPGKDKRYIYVKEYECECKHKMYNAQVEEVQDK
jgi:phage FluMu protein Com